MKEELERERRTLARSERQIGDGIARLERQEATVARLRAAGRDGTQAERLALAMQATLEEWRRHRALAELRVAALEARKTPQRPAGAPD